MTFQMNTAFSAKQPPLTTLFVVPLQAGEHTDGATVINTDDEFRHLSYDLLAKGARDARTPRLFKICGHLIYRHLGVLSSLAPLARRSSAHDLAGNQLIARAFLHDHQVQPGNRPGKRTGTIRSSQFDVCIHPPRAGKSVMGQPDTGLSPCEGGCMAGGATGVGVGM
jgi:hypothetical protein